MKNNRQDRILKAVRANGRVLGVLPLPERTFEVCLEAVKSVGSAVADVPPHLHEKHPEIRHAAVNQNAAALRHVPEPFRDASLCFVSVKNYPLALEWVPHHHRSKPLCAVAFFAKSDVFRWIPDDFKTLDMVLRAYREDPLNIQWIPDRFFYDPVVCRHVALSSAHGMLALPKEMRTDTLYLEAMERWSELVEFAPPHLISPAIAENAIKVNALLLRWIPIPLRIPTLCRDAVTRNGLALEHVPPELRDPDMIDAALNETPFAIEFVL